MGCDTRIMLPNDVRVRDVADVMGALAGLEISDWSRDYVSAHVDGAIISPSNTPSCADIRLLAKDSETLIDGEKEHFVLYHFESKHGRLLCPPSTRFWQAIGLGLIKFFGGKIDLNDCDSIDVDKVVRKRYRNNPEDGEEWNRFQRRILNLKPLVLA